MTRLAQRAFQSSDVLANFLTDGSSKFSRADGIAVSKTEYASVGFHQPKEMNVWFFVSCGHTEKFSKIDAQLEVHWVNIKARNFKMPLELTANISAVWWQNSVIALMKFTDDVFYSLVKCLKLLKAEPNLQRGVTSNM